ncbi:DMT family transporter [bacterium]|nr:DMT family transporter [bacterium]
MKYNDQRDGHPLYLLAGNYFVATMIAAVFWLLDPTATFSWIAIVFGMGLAVFFVGSFFLFARAVRAAGAALTQVSSRLSVGVPLLLSMLFFNEHASRFQWLGLCLTGITLFFFYFSLKKNTHYRLSAVEYGYLFAVLVGIGIGDFCMKLFQHTRPITEKSTFIVALFTFCLLYTVAALKIEHPTFEKATILRGGLLGIPNMFASFFLINALAELSTIVVYPVSNIGIILLTTLLVVWIWHEKLNRYGIAALVTGMVAILLLSF